MKMDSAEARQVELHMFILCNLCSATDLNDFSDKWVLEVLIQFYAVVRQHVLNSSIATVTKFIPEYSEHNTFLSRRWKQEKQWSNYKLYINVKCYRYWLVRLTRLRSRTAATRLMMNCLPKLELSPTTFYTHFCHHHPPHHRTTV